MQIASSLKRQREREQSPMAYTQVLREARLLPRSLPAALCPKILPQVPPDQQRYVYQELKTAGLAMFLDWQKYCASGYYSRQAALRLLLQQFLSATHSKQSCPTQILSLGAGFDTTWFQLQV